MNRMHRCALVLGLGFLASCGILPSDLSPSKETAAVAVTAAGAIPAGLPAHLSVGLDEDPGGTWMKNSGVPWDMRYAYFTYGWANNWGYGAHDGSWGLNFMQESSSQGFIPAVEYYVVNGEPGGGESAFLSKVQNPTTMAEYFGDFKLLLQNIKSFGKPVVVLLEGDGFGFLEQQSSDNPNASAAVASTGIPELASLPNTVAGWGLAFLQLRNAVGATNALLGIHVSAWAGGNDVAYQSTVSLSSEVTKVYRFLSPFGLTANQTGSTFDFLVGDPNDRDSDYYSLVLGDPNRWWDASDSAPVTSPSFNRYAAWLQLWNAQAGKRWILWQIPLGNSNHLDVCNAGGSRQGYKDNRPEYFFGPESTAHLTKWANAGVIGLLFGAGAGCQSSYQNDTYTDGQPFMQSRVKAFYAAGGLPLASSSGSSSSASAASTAQSSGSSTSATAGSAAVSPTFTSTATVSPAAIAPGATATMQVAVTSTGAPLDNGIVDVEVYDATYAKVGQQWFDAQSFTTGQTRSYAFEWTTPATAGTYTVAVGVFGPSWSPNYYWNPTEATFATAATDPAEYGFESDTQSWSTYSGGFITGVSSSTANAYAGTHSLAIGVAATGAATQTVSVASPPVPAGAHVTFHLWLPAGSAISSVQPFALQGPAGNWGWTGDWQAASSLATNAWNTLALDVPASAATPLYALGIELSTSGAWSGTVYVDSVSW